MIARQIEILREDQMMIQGIEGWKHHDKQKLIQPSTSSHQD